MTDAEKLTSIISGCIKYSASHLPDDILSRLRGMRDNERKHGENPLACSFYDAMLKNAAEAGRLGVPLCQDTGLIQFFARVGTEFPLLGSLNVCLCEAVRKATFETPLRPNCVDVFDGKNTGSNTGAGVPHVETELVPGARDLTLYIYMAGGGCSLPGAAAVFPPIDGMKNAVRFVIDRVAEFGANACPPLYVGVGFGGSADVAAQLSKKALLRKIGDANPDPRAAALEKDLAEALNSLSIGPGGVGGAETVMGVSVLHSERHPASLAVGVSFGCWAHRRVCLKVTENLSYEMLYHRGAAI